MPFSPSQPLHKSFTPPAPGSFPVRSLPSEFYSFIFNELTIHPKLSLLRSQCLVQCNRHWVKAQMHPRGVRSALLSAPDTWLTNVSMRAFLRCLPFPSPGDLPDPGIKLWSPALQVDSLPSEPSSVQFSRSVVSNSLRPHGLQHARPPCPSPTPRVHSNSCPLSQWCHPVILSSVVPFSSCLQSFPALRSFQMSQLFASGEQSIGVSASTSVLPVNIQD